MWQDIKYGLRILAKSPGFTTVAVLTLAIGIGANTAIFSLLNAVLLRPFPYKDPAQLAYVWTPSRQLPQVPIEAFGPSNGDFFDIQRDMRLFAAVTLFTQNSFNLAGAGMAQRVDGALVLPNFFSTLGVSPLLGRGIENQDAEPGSEHVAIISYALWKSAFGGSAQVLGKTLMLDAQVYHVIGVMPATFDYPNANELPYSQGTRTDVWLPWVLTAQQKADRDSASGSVIARLRPGATIEQAQAELDTFMPRLAALHGSSPIFQGLYAVVRPFNSIVLGSVRVLVWLLFGAVCLVLLIACANAANLLLARAASRAHEMGVRSALGARRGRLIRQVLTEALMLACAGGALGILFAYAAVRLLVRLNPGNIPRLSQTSLDLRVLLFTAGISLLTGILFGLLPAFGASRTNLAELLKQGGNRGAVGGSKKWRHGLIVGEVAIAVVLLVGSGLLIHSYLNLEDVQTGFSDSTLTMNIGLDGRYSKPEQRRAYFRNVLDKLGALPGVRNIGAVDDLPLSHSDSMSLFMVQGYPNKKDQTVNTRFASEGYFRAMGTPLLAGRFFTRNDGASKQPEVLIVNAAFAKTYFPGKSAVGQHVCVCYFTTSAVWPTVVGVVADVRHSNLEDAPSPQIYQPFWEDNPASAFIAIRTNLPPAKLIPVIRSAVREIDPDLAVADIQTMDQRATQASALRRFQMFLFAAFGGIALFLAAIGLYALMAYSVRLRTNEIGIRLALGAQKSHVWRLIIAQGMALTLAGILLGVAAALAAAKLLSSLLYGVAPIDPTTFILVIVVLAAASLLACYIPARRAMRIEPMDALRYE